ncbi:MAG: NADH-quinone oxidoreductase subunit NuoE [Desulfosudaceae bacterium]
MDSKSMISHITSEEEEKVDQIRSRLTEFETKRSNLIPLLQMVQNTLGYLPIEAIQPVAEHLAIPTTEIYGVASFYNQFRFNPPGKFPIRVCMGTACHVRGGDIILENFERKLDIEEGETTEDREFSLERVACVGCCALAPVALVGEKVHGYMSPSKIEGFFTQITTNKMIAAREADKDHGSD